MLSSLKSFFHNFRSYPLRGILTLLTLTIGVGTLIITTSLNMDITSAINANSSEQGLRIVIANGELDENGQLIIDRKESSFTPDITSILESGYENLSDVCIVTDSWIDSKISTGGKSYELRSAVQVNASYAELMNLEIIAGSFFTEEDVNLRNSYIVISSLTAKLLYTLPEQAVGQIIRIQGKSKEEAYTVVGVYADVSELERQVFGIGDIIMPLASGVPVGAKYHPVQYNAVIMARVTSDSITAAESRIRTVLELEYGENLILSVWEGSKSGPSPLLEESRRSVSTFALAVNILGIVILAISSIGIFSIMLVEILNRTRDIGLRRALGTTKRGILRFFMGQALYYTFFGSIMGVAAAAALYRIIGIFLMPLFDASGFRFTDLNFTVPGIIPIVIAVGAALLFGAVFSFFPALSASRTPIIDCIREDAA